LKYTGIHFNNANVNKPADATNAEKPVEKPAKDQGHNKIQKRKSLSVL
jgi:hypothetical protein